MSITIMKRPKTLEERPETVPERSYYFQERSSRDAVTPWFTFTLQNRNCHILSI